MIGVEASIAARGTAATGPAAAAAATTVDYDAFLRLLIATMKNQDPTAPNDPAETLSQLASFSNVEQGVKLNGKIHELISLSAAGQGASLIGKTISSLDGSIQGVAKSVEMKDGELAVVLENGSRLSLSDGFRVA
jgi:flagellar basal-body rod modification protein FlgD